GVGQRDLGGEVDDLGHAGGVHCDVRPHAGLALGVDDVGRPGVAPVDELADGELESPVGDVVVGDVERAAGVGVDGGEAPDVLAALGYAAAGAVDLADHGGVGGDAVEEGPDDRPVGAHLADHQIAVGVVVGADV